MIVHKIEIRKLAKPVAEVSANPCAGAVLMLVSEAPPKPLPENASLLTKAGRLRRELTKWIKAGAKLVPKEVRAQRFALCLACELYNPKGNAGLGECGHKACGCVAKAKVALATSKCPLKPAKWDAWGGPVPK